MGNLPVFFPGERGARAGFWTRADFQFLPFLLVVPFGDPRHHEQRVIDALFLSLCGLLADALWKARLLPSFSALRIDFFPSTLLGLSQSKFMNSPVSALPG